jgi:hypothetical protein
MALTQKTGFIITTVGLVVVVMFLGLGAYLITASNSASNKQEGNKAATEGTAGLRANDYSDNPDEIRKNAAGGDGTDPTGTKNKAASAAFTDGLYLVGEDISAGKYRSDGLGDCTWKRMNALAGYKNVTATATVNGPTTVEIMKEDKAFSSTGCGTWTLQ